MKMFAKRLSLRQWLAIALVPLALAGAWFGIRSAFGITAFNPQNMPVGWVAQNDLTNYDLRSGHETLFRGDYEKEKWSGNLLAYNLDANGNLGTATQPWNGGAAHQMDLQGWQNRLIATRKDDGTAIPFTWASLSAAQQTAIGSTAMLDYIRGDQSNEVQQSPPGPYYFREREEGAFGAVIHSRPYYLADATYPTVFVGANDGFLHAINASNGSERWAYVPSMIISKLKNLATYPSFIPDYYVDGSINVGKILNGSKRVLVGMLGAGGKGVYALDITGGSRLQPASESAVASNALWEITNTAINGVASTSYQNLGYTFGVSSIYKVGSTDSVIIGNGYNDAGDYQAYLYVINANTGAQVAAIKAGTSGSSTSPNGLSSPVVVDTDNDGVADIAYAGDLNGTMWKFNLSTNTATALLTTSPLRPITGTPGVAVHPNGGYMVTFGTGSLFTPADMDTTGTDSLYGIWDGASANNTALLSQTITDRCFTSGNATVPATPACTGATRVRTVTSNQPDWSPCASTCSPAHHKGWKVDLPAGERSLGDGSFIENARFYVNTYNPTVSTTVQASTVRGSNWLMELDYLTGGAKNLPFLDLSNNQVIDNDDRVKDPTTKAPVLTTDGIAIGRYLGIGVQSQPILVQLSSLNDTLFNQNPDVTIVVADPGTVSGVSGGHFDVDIYYGGQVNGASAVATITIGTSGQSSGFPATLGAIEVDGIEVIPALTTSDIPNGTASNTIAALMASKVQNDFTATAKNNVITLTAPQGTRFNGKTITVNPGTSQALVAATSGTPSTFMFTFSGGNTSNAGNVQYTKTLAGNTASMIYSGNNLGNIIDLGKNKTPTQAAANFKGDVNGKNNFIAALGGATGCTGQPVTVVCVSYPGVYDNGLLPTMGTLTNQGTITIAISASTGGVAPVSQSGWTNFSTAVTAPAFNSAGVDGDVVGDACTSCQSDQHFHQYDDTFNVTGVNMLNPSSSTLNIKNAIPQLNIPFKVLLMNQYLSPAAKIHIGNPAYVYNLDFGYIRAKNYLTSATLDLATLQTYQRDPNTVWPGSASTDADKLAAPKYIGSLAINFPIDAMSQKDWWGNGDIRVGLHPSVTGCVKKSAGTTDGNMFQPVIPPAAPNDGPGTLGYNAGTTAATATGVRHNGALTMELVRANTPNSAIELSVPGRPEFGWRVKGSLYSQYVLAEWTIFWHHPNGKCYGTAGWTKFAPTEADTASNAVQPAGTTDPHIGTLSGDASSGLTITDVTTTTNGNVSTTAITYSDGTHATIVRTENADGSVTIVTTDNAGQVTTQTIANTDGTLKSGGDERGLQAKTGRISWRELIKP